MRKTILLCAALGFMLSACSNNNGNQMTGDQYKLLQDHEQENEVHY